MTQTPQPVTVFNYQDLRDELPFFNILLILDLVQPYHVREDLRVAAILNDTPREVYIKSSELLDCMPPHQYQRLTAHVPTYTAPESDLIKTTIL